MCRRRCGPRRSNCNASVRNRKSRNQEIPHMWTKSLLVLSSAILAASSIFAVGSLRATPRDPWRSTQTVEAADFVKELQQVKDPHPTVIYVGVKTLYEGGHIPGAVFYGPGSTEQGLADLKKFAATLPKNSDVVLYCGCCPLEKCPNLRPAFSALQDSGFARLRVL